MSVIVIGVFFMFKVAVVVIVLAGAAMALDYATTQQARSRIAEQVKASAPTSVPVIAKPTLQQGLFYCETHNFIVRPTMKGFPTNT